MFNSLSFTTLITLKENFNKAQHKPLSGHKKRIYALDWLKNTNNLLTGSVDTTIRQWDIANETFNEFKGHTDAITQIKASPNDSNIFLSCSNDRYVKLWDIRQAKSIHNEKTKNGIKCVAFSPDSNTIALNNKYSDILQIFDRGSFTQVSQIDLKTKINEFEYTRDGKDILITNDTGLSRMNASTFEIDSIINDAPFPYTSISIDKNNKVFFVGGVDGVIIEMDMEEMMGKRIYKKGDQSIRKLQVSNDGKYLATIYEGENIDFFSTECGCPIYSIITENVEYSLSWSKNDNVNKNLIGYCGDDKSTRNGDEGNVHVLII